MNAVSKLTRYAWIVVALLWFVGLLNYLDRLMLTSMRTSIVADIAMSEAQFGLLTTVFLWTYGAVSPLGGFLADRFSRRWVIIGSLLVWSVVTWWTGHVHSLNEMLVARSLMGVSEACYVPAALALVVDYHRGRTRSLATGLHISGMYVGIALGGIGGYIADSFGWRLAFTLFGAIGVGYALVLMLSLHDAVAEPAPTPSTHEQIPNKVGSGKGLWASLGGMSFNCLVLYYCLYGAACWAILGWMPTFLMERFHLSQGQSGMMATVWLQAAALLGVLVGGRWADRWVQRNIRGRLYVPCIGLCIGGPFLFLAVATVSPVLVIGSLIVLGVTRGFSDANGMPILCQIAPPHYRATGYGLINCFSTFVGGLMTYGAGLTRDHGGQLSMVFQVSAIGLVLAAVLLLFIRPRKEREIA